MSPKDTTGGRRIVVQPEAGYLHYETDDCVDRGCEPVVSGNGLTFGQLREANLARLNVFPGHGDSPWDEQDWTVAVAGELGETAEAILDLVLLLTGVTASFGRAADYLKKIRRGVVVRDKPIPSADEVMEELADTVTYIDLLAARLNRDLGEAVRTKFNKVSDGISAEIKL